MIEIADLKEQCQKGNAKTSPTKTSMGNAVTFNKFSSGCRASAHPELKSLQ